MSGVLTAKILSDGETKLLSAVSDKVLAAASPEKAKLPPNFNPSPMRRRAVTYVELETGLVIRAEAQLTTQAGVGAGAVRNKTVVVSQRLPSQ